jgi:DNA repair protein RecN (Recombination protein N)
VLVELRIRDVAIIEALTLPLGPGLTVLTGETGAGKSIVVEALGLLLGERASADLVRGGAARATVEGTFELGARGDLLALLDARGIDHDGGTVVLKREVVAGVGGRARAWINGTAVTAHQLAEVGRALVDVHGQHDAQSLLDAAAQRAILDAFAGAAAEAAAVRGAYAALAEAEHAARDLTTRRDDARRREDWLRHLVRELSEARLRVGEDAALAEEEQRLAHAVELRALAEESAQRLDGDGDTVLPLLATVRRPLDKLARIDPAAARFTDALATGVVQLQELVRDLAAYADGVRDDPARLAQLRARRDAIHSLTRKHGGSEATALAALTDARAELELLDAAALDAGALDRRVAEARERLRAAAAALSRKRAAAAAALADAVDALLPGLGLPEGRFAVRLVAREAPGGDGAEEVEFTVALNPGYEARPLARVASGGELARVMLALKTILARVDRVPTLVFDEVDAGIGGTVGRQVGARMREVAAHHQVLAITHLPQIAARAHAHVVVRKDATGGVTTATVQVVAEGEREREIARMLSGDTESAVARAHAAELLATGDDRPRAAGRRPRK